MLRKNITRTLKEIRAAGGTNAVRAYLSAHPEENAKLLKHQQQAEERQTARDMKKHQPRVTGISDNGQFVHVGFTRNNGERVIGCYERIYWDYGPQKRARADWARQVAYWNPPAVSKVEVTGAPQPKPGKRRHS